MIKVYMSNDKSQYVSPPCYFLYHTTENKMTTRISIVKITAPEEACALAKNSRAIPSAKTTVAGNIFQEDAPKPFISNGSPGLFEDLSKSGTERNMQLQATTQDPQGNDWSTSTAIFTSLPVPGKSGRSKIRYTDDWPGKKPVESPKTLTTFVIWRLQLKTPEEYERDRTEKYAQYFQGNNILPISEITQALEPWTLSFVITDLRIKSLAGLKNDNFENLL